MVCAVLVVLVGDAVGAVYWLVMCCCTCVDITFVGLGVLHFGCGCMLIVLVSIFLFSFIWVVGLDWLVWWFDDLGLFWFVYGCLFTWLCVLLAAVWIGG